MPSTIAASPSFAMLRGLAIAIVTAVVWSVVSNATAHAAPPVVVPSGATTACYEPARFRQVDVDGDGRPDLVRTCTLDDVRTGVTISPNTGAGYGEPYAEEIPLTDEWGTTYCGGAKPVFVEATGDARLDMVVACGRIVAILPRNTANTGYDDAVLLEHPDPDTVPAAPNCGGIIVANVNGDGRADLVIPCPAYFVGAGANYAGGVQVYTSTPTGFDASQMLVHPAPLNTSRCGLGTFVNDVDSDGFDDVLMSCGGYPPSLFRRTADGSAFRAIEVLDTPLGCEGMFAELDGADDGTLVVGCPGLNAGGRISAGGVVVLRWDAIDGEFVRTHLFEPTTPRSYANCGRTFQTVDASGDGRDDVAFDCDSGWGYLAGQGNGTFLATRVQDNSPACGDFSRADFDVDGTEDLVAACNNSIVFLMGRADHSGRDRVTIPTWLNPGWSLAAQCIHLNVADVDADGRPDLIAACPRLDRPGLTYPDAGDHGGFITISRTAANTGFASPVLHRLPNGSDRQCGTSMGVVPSVAPAAPRLLVACTGSAAGNGGPTYLLSRNATNTGYLDPEPIVDGGGAGGDGNGGDGTTDGGTPPGGGGSGSAGTTGGGTPPGGGSTDGDGNGGLGPRQQVTCPTRTVAMRIGATSAPLASVLCMGAWRVTARPAAGEVAGGRYVAPSAQIGTFPVRFESIDGLQAQLVEFVVGRERPVLTKPSASCAASVRGRAACTLTVRLPLLAGAGTARIVVQRQVRRGTRGVWAPAGAPLPLPRTVGTARATQRVLPGRIRFRVEVPAGPLRDAAASAWVSHTVR